MKKLSDLMTIKIDVSNRTVFRVLGIILVFVVGLQLVVALAQPLLLIFLAFFLALALSPPVNYLAKKMPWKSRGLATGIVFVTALSLVVILVSTLVPPIVRQTNQLIEQVPVYLEELQEQEGFIGGLIEQYDLEERSGEVQDEVVDRVSGAGEPILNFLGRITTSIVATLTVLVLTFFMLIEGPKWLQRFWRLLPKEQRQGRQALARKMYRVVTSYVNGQLLIATMNAIATAIVLLLLGIPYALSLAAIVGLLGLIPIIGATLGAIIVVVAGLFQSPMAAIVLAVYYIVYQQVENNIIQPAVQSKSIGMSPLLILISVIIGISLMGIVGGLIAIPIAGCIQVLINHHLDQRNQSTA